MKIILENLTDIELLEIVEECQKEYFDTDSIVRKLSKQFFGGESLIQMMSVSIKILPIVASRMRDYSPYLI